MLASGLRATGLFSGLNEQALCEQTAWSGVAARGQVYLRGTGRLFPNGSGRLLEEKLDCLPQLWQQPTLSCVHSFKKFLSRRVEGGAEARPLRGKSRAQALAVHQQGPPPSCAPHHMPHPHHHSTYRLTTAQHGGSILAPSHRRGNCPGLKS